MPELITTDGTRLHYGAAGDGAVIVFVPGIATPARWWSHQVAELASYARVITLDLRGTGSSERTERGPRLGRYAADLHELLATLDLREVVLVGWSLGVSLSLAYLDLFGSGRIGRLVLVEGSPKLISDAEWSLGFIDLPGAVKFTEAMPAAYEETMSGLVRSMFVDPSAEPELAELEAAAVATDPHHTASLLWNHLTQDWRDVLPHIDRPTTVVAGGKSTVITSDASRFTAEAIPGATFELFPDAGHALFREEPERFNALLRDQLRP